MVSPVCFLILPGVFVMVQNYIDTLCVLLHRASLNSKSSVFVIILIPHTVLSMRKQDRTLLT